MSRFSLRVRLACVIAALVAAAGDRALAQVGGDKSQQPAKQPPAAAALAKEKTIRAITIGADQARLAALADLEANHANDPLLPAILIESLKRQRKIGGVTETLLKLVAMLGKYKTPETVDALIEAAGSPNAPLVMVVVDALGKIGDKKATDAIIKLAERREFKSLFGFRKCVIVALTRIHDSKAVDFLIKQLPALDGQLQFDVVHYLSYMSRQQFGNDVKQWSTWWTDNGDDFHFPGDAAKFSLESPPPPDFVWKGHVPQFYGLYVHAKRVVFVLDCSSSMTAKLGQTTRIEQAKKELCGAIADLPAETEFDIVVFNDDAKAWHGKLVAATPGNKDSAIRFVSYIGLAKGTASYDALDLAFRIDGNTEAVFFLSDGQPTAGKIQDPSAIVEAITKANVFRRVAIYSIAVGADGQFDQFLRALSEKNNGIFKAVN